jgi:hypothetical protein
VLVVAEVIGEFTLQGGLQHDPGQLLQQTTVTGQLQPLLTGLGHQLRDQGLVHSGGWLLLPRPFRRLLSHCGSIRRRHRDRHQVSP